MKFILIIICGFCYSAYGQVEDNFSDGNFTADPTWVGTTSLFSVSSAGQLQLNGAGSSGAWLAVPFEASSLARVTWKIFVRQAFSGSGSNFGRIYLVSDVGDVMGSAHGYYLQMGEPGSKDAIELFRQDGATRSSVCRAREAGIAGSFSAGIQVELTKGKWTLSVDYTGGTNYVSEAVGVDSLYQSAHFFAVMCAYTPSNDTKFFYDDIEISFSAPSPDPVIIPSASFKNKDIIITEIFPDPVPSVGLPPFEYVEIFNRSSSPCALANWLLTDGNSSASLPEKILHPNEYLVLISPSSSAAFSGFGNVVSVPGFPSLNNDSDHVMLKDAAGLMIDSVNYSLEWYHDKNKEDGGWSLELIDPGNPCGEEDNWHGSENSSGGTPGSVNSVNAQKPDITGPRLVAVTVESVSVILLTFDKKLSRTTPAVVSIAPNSPVSNIHFTDASLRQIAIALTSPLEPGIQYVVSVAGAADCNLNTIQNEFNSLPFSLPQKADSLDIVVNEILFNPRPSGADFVEVYNRSAKYISLENWKLSNFSDGYPDGVESIGAGALTLSPGAYLVFTQDAAAVLNNYPSGKPERFVKMPMPSLPDDAGSVALLDERGRVIDYFFYAKEYHNRLLQDDEGVSLERIAFSGPSNDPQNWNSASAREGFATPGYLNSSSRQGIMLDPGRVVVEPVAFVPEPGEPGFTLISYQFDSPGFVANVRIVDQQGRLVKTLGLNETLGSEGAFHWSGDRDDGGRARIGYYTVWFEAFDLSGTLRTFRKRVIVAML